MSNEHDKAKLEAVLTLLKMTGQVGIFSVSHELDGLHLSISPGYAFTGIDLAKEIADMSNGAIAADRISVRKS